MREFRSEAILATQESPESRERARDEFLRPARAFQECTQELFVSGTLNHAYIEQVAKNYRLDDRSLYPLIEFADFARTTGGNVDKLLDQFHKETDSFEPNDQLLAQRLLGFSPRYECMVEPNDLGFTVLFTHPADYYRWVYGDDAFLKIMEERAREQGLTTDDLYALPRNFYTQSHDSALSDGYEIYDNAHEVSVISAYIDPQNPHWEDKYFQLVAHEWRHAAHYALLPKIRETTLRHTRAQDQLAWAIKHGKHSFIDDAVYEYIRALHDYVKWSLLDELLAMAGEKKFNSQESIEDLTVMNDPSALYDYYGTSRDDLINTLRSQEAPDKNIQQTRQLLDPRIERLQSEYPAIVTQVVSSLDAARVRLRLNPDDLSAGMAMEAATCDRFEDFMDRVNKLAGQ